MRVEPRPTLRFAIGFCLAAAALMALGYAHAQLSPDDSLRLYAVNIWQDPPQSWGPGHGIYLGKGLVSPPSTSSAQPLAPSRACASPAWTCPRMPSGKAISSEWI